MQAGRGGGEGEFRHGVGGGGGLRDHALVSVKDFVDGYCYREFRGRVVVVALGVEGFGFVGACDLVRQCIFQNS